MAQQMVTAGWRHAALATAIIAALGITACSKKAAPAAPAAGQPVADAATNAAPVAPVDSAADLLTKAKTAENEKRLYAPAGNNAIEYYLALRQRNPSDASATNALTDLFPYAMIATEQNLKKGDEAGRVEAARIFALLERVDTNAPSLPRLRAMMQKEAGDELKQQQDAAKKAQDDLAKKTAADKAAALVKAQQQAAAQQAAAAPTPPPQQAAPPPRPVQAQAPPPPPVQEQPPPPPPKPARPAGLPAVISSVQPAYPRDALRDGLSGEVTVTFTVDPDGSVSGASIVSSNPRRVFDSAALEAIKKWRFAASSDSSSGRRTFAFNPGN